MAPGRMTRSSYQWTPMQLREIKRALQVLDAVSNGQLREATLLAAKASPREEESRRRSRRATHEKIDELIAGLAFRL